MARPKIIIDPLEVEKLAAMSCSIQEIASFFGCSRDTIERRFAANILKGKDKGKIKLRRLMWQNAEKGNAVMQLWLSKNILGYTDKLEQTVNGEMKTISLSYSVPKKAIDIKPNDE